MIRLRHLAPLAALALLAAGIDPISAATKKTIIPYPLDSCLVSDERFAGHPGEPVSTVYKGQEFKFCCASCLEDFARRPKRWMTALEQAVIERQKPTYPLATCIVTGEPLGAPAIDLVHEGRLVRVANEKAARSFRKNPAKYLPALDTAAATPAPAASPES